jgi:NAD(P)-dependent dehydrogenase (short-subunit alcohol dehydrogenase family)
LSTTPDIRPWALVLGSSSGFGGAAALELARNGYSIFGVHLDRKSTMANVDRLVSNIKDAGADAVFFNVNAADSEKREEVLAEMARRTEAGTTGTVRVLLHSLAFGTLKRFVADVAGDEITPAQMAMTLDVMANSLVYWTQGVVRHGLLRAGGRVFALTSAGSHRVWPFYGPVSAAKAALEANIRQLSVELIPLGITANAIQAGVTDTPALRKIPGNDEMISRVMATHPGGRLTTPEDVARCLVDLSRPGTAWLTGNTIRVDGGEDLVG